MFLPVYIHILGCCVRQSARIIHIKRIPLTAAIPSTTTTTTANTTTAASNTSNTDRNNCDKKDSMSVLVPPLPVLLRTVLPAVQPIVLPLLSNTNDDPIILLKTGDKAICRFRFLYRPEYLVLLGNSDNTMVMREGKTIGVGKVLSLGPQQ